MTTVGVHFKATEGWNQGGNGDNALGFTALPGGFCNDKLTCGLMGNEGVWWTTEAPVDDDSVHTVLALWCVDDSYETRAMEDRNYASIRCVKD